MNNFPTTSINIPPDIPSFAAIGSCIVIGICLPHKEKKNYTATVGHVGKE